MGKLAGYTGSVYIGSNIAGIKSWTLDYIMSVAETTGFDSSGHKTFIPTIDEWSGSFEGYKDAAPQTIGTEIALELRESQTATQKWAGQAIITAIHPATATDGVVTYSYDFQGTATLTTKSTT